MLDGSIFQTLLDERFSGVLADVKAVGVAVSGGPDSLALAHLVCGWGQACGVAVYLVTVDHGLRAVAADEAAMVARYAVQWGAEHVTLRWEGEKPEAGILEEARGARYALIAEYCAQYGITCVFVGHHQDDQAETFLFRLARGSGLNGLGGMRPVQAMGDMMILRPLLDMSKDVLISYCDTHGFEYSQDRTNEDEMYMRPRLRRARSALEAEGLTSKRLAVTAGRLARAREALDSIVQERFEILTKEKDTKRVVFQNNLWQKEPEEIALRLVISVIERIGAGGDYLPRMEKIEDLCARLRMAGGFQTCTLGGVIFSRDDKADEIIMLFER